MIEIICYEDPNHHIGEDFSIDDFDKYKFKSLKKYRGKDAKKGRRYYDEDEDEDEDTDEDTDEDKLPNEAHDDDDDVIPHRKKSPTPQKPNKKYYFEDNDEHGVKMKYRLQMVMCQYETILDIFRSFDLFPAMVGFDGKRVYFTPNALIAYQLMIDEIHLKGGNDIIKHRINKYFKYGFSIVFPPSMRKWEASDFENNYEQEHIRYKGTNENLGPLKFNTPSSH